MKTWPDRLKKNAVGLLLALALCLLFAGAASARGGPSALWLLPAAGGALGGWWWWRKPRIRSAAPGALRCLDRLALGPGSTLYLVEVEGRRLLVACGEKTAVLLSRLPPRVDGKSEDRI